MKFFVTSKISENMFETPEGFLVCVGVPVARTGVQEYGEGETPLETLNGVVKVHRDEAEVFRPETIASFAGKAITISHPVDFVTPGNWSVLSKGVLQNPRRGDGNAKEDLIADLLITDQVAIQLVKSGLREVSCGYTADYEQTELGEGVQKNIVGNHLALVDQGRAGSRYAIHDHKGEKKMTLKERIKAIFAKAQDEAMKVAEDEAKEDKKDSKDEDKKDDAKDEDGDNKPSYDELMKRVTDLEDTLKGMTSKDEDKDDDKKDDSKDEDKESEILSRIQALEAAIKKLSGSKDEDKKDDDKTDDEDQDGDDDETDDDDFEESSMVGDTASRAEILAPGIDASTKDVKVKALKASYATKEGKKVIDSLTGGKPTFDSKAKVDVLFVAASEVLKSQRTDEFAKSKRTKDGSENGNADEGAMTPDKLNEINAKFYKQA